ncbi:HEAT repeat domain-containing protein [Evansella tamaricis]|uniref:HEAT repeat domain-containing protein n=1 Tax=Evansella tamaricis TaxID=2069301 RepID=A0ABS6JBY5_9BACI|nr:HEAT repeat domain-containing protein [Evansella tamaricis]MBU9711160.1 HEAT repeat domain-containing protein [Evansella tamaricis]
MDKIMILKLVSIMIFILLLTQFSLMIYMVISKHQLNKREERKEKLKAKIVPFLDQYIRNNEPIQTRLLNDNVAKKEIIEESLNQYLRIFNMDDTIDRIYALAEEVLRDRYATLLKSRKWSDRMNALYFIEDFKITSLKDEVFAGIPKNAPVSLDEELKQRLRTLASIQDKRVLGLIRRLNKASVIFLKEILRRLDQAYIEELISSGSDLPVPLHLALLSVISEKKGMENIPFVENSLEHDEEEVRIQSLKALLSIGYFPNPDRLSHFLHSDIWAERMTAAKIAGRFKLSRFKKDLVVLVESDKEWWVQFAASEALSKFTDGDVILSYLYENSERQNVKEITNHWISLGGS